MIYIVGIFAQSKYCGARETVVASECLETIFISRQGLGIDVPAATDKYFWKRCFLLGPCKRIKRKTTETTKAILYGSL
jgi:hypothetical protein